MAGLLEHIFSTLEIENLGQQQAKEYLCYLQEIQPQWRTMDDKIKFLGYQERLIHRLLAIDHKKVSDLHNRLVKGRQGIKFKKAKYLLIEPHGLSYLKTAALTGFKVIIV